jgi:hypothetical protein
MRPSPGSLYSIISQQIATASDKAAFRPRYGFVSGPGFGARKFEKGLALCKAVRYFLMQINGNDRSISEN